MEVKNTKYELFREDVSQTARQAKQKISKGKQEEEIPIPIRNSLSSQQAVKKNSHSYYLLIDLHRVS
jgi:hypothetical protein